MRSTGVISSAQLRELEADIRDELARIERSLANEVQLLHRRSHIQDRFRSAQCALSARRRSSSDHPAGSLVGHGTPGAPGN